MVETAKNYRINVCSTSGHSDGVFCPVAPGVIVASHYKNNYSQSFPEWNVFQIPNNLNNFNHPKDWWVKDNNINNNQSFSSHIQKHAKSWVGNFKETVFEVNMLVLDEKNVVAMKDYPPLTEWLSKQGISVHLFDLRARSFWDGGWHCFTLDISREDVKEDLFPNKGDNGVYWRLK
jgi:N-dimethylarginine dimethylaminohydrolase